MPEFQTNWKKNESSILQQHFQGHYQENIFLNETKDSNQIMDAIPLRKVSVSQVPNYFGGLNR